MKYFLILSPVPDVGMGPAGIVGDQFDEFLLAGIPNPELVSE